MSKGVAMGDETVNAPAGWYPTDAGTRRYWSGTEWLDIPDPDASRFDAPQPENTPTPPDWQDVPHLATPPAPPVEAPETHAAAASNSSKTVFIVAAVVGALVLVGIAAFVLRPRGDSGAPLLGKDARIQDAYSSCNLGSKTGANLGDGGATLTLDGKGEEDSTGLALTDLVCPLVALKTPDSVISNMDSTRALDGTQTATWDGIKATWRYHPDSGMEVVLTTN